MIFNRFQRREILMGRMTEIRSTAEPVVKVGRTYALQAGRGKPGIGRIEITAVEPKGRAWIVRFRLVQDVPRLLHRDSSHGYTSDPNLALEKEPEAVTELDQRRITAEAHAIADDRQRQVWLEERENITASLERLKAAGIDVSDVRVMQLRLRSLDRRLAA